MFVNNWHARKCCFYFLLRGKGMDGHLRGDLFQKELCVTKPEK